MIYYISDLHLFHDNIIKYEDRPYKNVFEMNEDIVKIWNKKVKKEDKVYIVGDFSFGGPEESNKILLRLNGKKYLVSGNHDFHLLSKRLFNKNIFEETNEYQRIRDNGRDVILFHYPILVWDKQHYGSYHLYGHVHSNKDSNHPLHHLPKNSYNVSWDKIKEPMTLDEIINFYGG